VAGETKAESSAEPIEVEAANPPVIVDSADLTISALAEAILTRRIRPRTADVRRLAEAVLAAKAKKQKKKAARKAPGKKRKLSKIPGQKKAK
jgi:hypothetical protein